METEKKKSLIEALLFVSGEPVSTVDLKNTLDIPEAEVRELVSELIHEYSERGGGVVISEVGGGFQMHTSPDLIEGIRKYKGASKSQKLSLPALETLAIIAYKQPIIKAEIEEIRGVNADGLLKSLIDKHFIKIVGKKEAPGRPMLYATTKEFLQHFGLKDLTELPTLKDLEREDSV